MLLLERLKQSLSRLLSRKDAPPPEPRRATYAAEDGIIEITVPPIPAEREAESAHHQFIVEHWKRLAAAAFEGFQRHGIGVVVIEARERQAAFEHPFTAHALAYATGLGTGLFLFRGGASAPRPYHAAGTPAPPDAFRAAQAPLN